MRLFNASAMAILMTVAAPASAAPTYLACEVTSSEGTITRIDVTADEEGGTVTTLIVKTGYSERQNAVFSPTAVKWNSPMGFARIEYELSRTNLSFVRTLVLSKATPPDRGACKVQAAPKRAF